MAAATGATAGLCISVHLLFGWQATLLAGIPVGLFRRRHALVLGAAGVGLGWLLLVSYNLAVASYETVRMLHFMGSLLGNMPVPGVVAVTMLLGAVLGLLGSWIGLRAAFLRRPWSPDPSSIENVPQE